MSKLPIYIWTAKVKSQVADKPVMMELDVEAPNIDIALEAARALSPDGFVVYSVRTDPNKMVMG
jgi:hypothetical protein